MSQFLGSCGTTVICGDQISLFYGLNVGHSDDSEMFTGIGTIKFNPDNFYIHQNLGNTDEVHINFRKELDVIKKNLSVDTPGDAENLSWFFTSVAINITDMKGVLVGSDTPHVAVNINQSTDRSAVGDNILNKTFYITSTTTGDTLPFTGPTGRTSIPANSWLWLQTSGQAGTVNNMQLFIEYTEE